MSQTAVDDRYFQTERVWKILLRIAPPVMLAQLIQALYNIVDSYFVGQYSNSGLTALSVIFPVQLIITAIAVGTGVGVNTYMARMYAFGKKRAADCTAGTGMVLAVISWAVFAAAALLLMVAYNMSGWRTFLQVVLRSPKSDAAVLLLTFFLTVIFDLVVAIGVGLSLACLLFMTRMANVAVIKEWKYVEDEDAQGRFRHVPEHVMVYEIDGPMFFGAADQIPHIDPRGTRRVMILRMRSVPALDITALNSLARLWKECQRHRVQLILSHVNEQPLSVMRKSGFYEAVGEEWFCPNIDTALELASKL